MRAEKLAVSRPSGCPSPPHRWSASARPSRRPPAAVGGGTRSRGRADSRRATASVTAPRRVSAGRMELPAGDGRGRVLRPPVGVEGDGKARLLHQPRGGQPGDTRAHHSHRPSVPRQAGAPPPVGPCPRRESSQPRHGRNCGPGACRPAVRPRPGTRPGGRGASRLASGSPGRAPRPSAAGRWTQRQRAARWRTRAARQRAGRAQPADQLTAVEHA